MGEHFYTYPTVIELRPVNPTPTVRDGDTDRFVPPAASDRVDSAGAQTNAWQSERAAWSW